MSAVAPSRAALCRGRWFARLQYVLPQHGISRLVLKATRVRAGWFKNALIRGFLRMFDVDMRDAVQTQAAFDQVVSEGRSIASAKAPGVQRVRRELVPIFAERGACGHRQQSRRSERLLGAEGPLAFNRQGWRV